MEIIAKKLSLMIKELSLFSQTSIDLNSLNTRESIAEKLFNSIKEIFDFDFLFIFIKEGLKKGKIFSFSNSLFSEILDSEKKRFLTQLDNFFDNYVITYEEPKKFKGNSNKFCNSTNSQLFFPLQTGKNIVGCMEISCIDKNAFDESKANYILSLSLQAAMAVRNVNLYEEVVSEKRQKELWLTSLYEFGDLIFDSENLLNRITAKIFSMFDIKGCSIYLVNNNKLEKKIEKGELIQVKDIDLKAFNTRNIVFDEVSNIISVPLNVKEKTIGVLNIFKKNNEKLTEDNKQLLFYIATTAAIAVENTKLYKIEIEKEKMDQELLMAQKIQENFLPEKLPEIKNLNISTFFKPAKVIGGDYYDFFENKNELIVCIADVSGKSIPAALLMTVFKSVVNSVINFKDPLLDHLSKINRIISNELSSDKFITGVLAKINTEKKEIEIIPAGHEPVLWYHSDKNEISAEYLKSLPIGIDENYKYSSTKFKYNENDIFVFYTDGVNDSRNNRKDFFGREKIKEIVLKNSSKTSNEICNIIKTKIDDFSGDIQSDDITLIIIKVGKSDN